VVEFFQLAGPVALTLNLATLLLGYYGARVLRLSKQQSTTVSIESGIQRGTLGTTVAATLIGNPVMTISAAIYSLIMFATAAGSIYLGQRTIPQVEETVSVEA